MQSSSLLFKQPQLDSQQGEWPSLFQTVTVCGVQAHFVQCKYNPQCVLVTPYFIDYLWTTLYGRGCTHSKWPWFMVQYNQRLKRIDNYGLCSSWIVVHGNRMVYSNRLPLNSSEIAQNHHFCFPEITIGFEQSTYTVQEAPQSTVATVCADILEGSVQMGIGFTFGTIDGLAGTWEGICGEYHWLQFGI